MLTEWDDFLIHQIVSTMDHVGSSDPRWHDRYWFHLGDVQGEVLLGVGMGVYPNRDVMDGFSLGVVEGAQHNTLVSRELGGIATRRSGRCASTSRRACDASGSRSSPTTSRSPTTWSGTRRCPRSRSSRTSSATRAASPATTRATTSRAASAARSRSRAAPGRSTRSASGACATDPGACGPGRESPSPR